MEANFFCEEECISLATKFYLGKASKRKVCDSHAHSVSQALYPIDTFDFITSAEDAMLYEQRLQSVTKGRKHLELLKKKAREELETALQDLDSAKEKAVELVEKGYEAHKRRTQQLHFQIEVGIETLNQQFNSYMKSRESEVSKVGSLVMTGGDQPIPSLMQTKVFDNSLELLEVVVKGMCQAHLPLEEYLSIVLDPELQRKEAENLLKIAEEDYMTEDFISLKTAAFKCAHSIALCYSEKATETSKSIEQKLKEIGEERTNAKEKVITSDTKAVCSLSETHTKDITTLETAKEWEKAKQIYLKAISYINAFSCSKETAGLYFSFAKFLAARQSNGEAETYYNLALYIQKAHFPEDVETANTYKKLGKLYSSRKRLEEAENCYKSAISIRNLNFPNDYKTSRTYYKLGVFYQNLKRYREASEVYSQALNIQRMCVPNVENLVCILWSLGEVSKDMNRTEESVQFYIQAIQEDTPNSWRQARLYKALGDVYKSIQQNIESEESYNSALTIVKSLPLSSMNSVVYLNNLGTELERLMRFEDAEFCYRTGTMNEKSTDKHTAALLFFNLGGIKLRSNKYSEAIQNFNAALRILVVHYPNRKLTAQVYTSLGVVHMHLGHLKEAEHCYRSAAKILDVVAPDCILRIITYMDLGLICQKVEKYEEAEHYERAILPQLETHFPNEVLTAQLLMNLGALYQVTGRTADAELWFVKCLQILESAHPNQLLFIGVLYYNLAINCVLQDKTEGAISFFVKAISLRSNESECSAGKNIVYYEYPQEVEEEDQPNEYSIKISQGLIIIPNFLCEAYYYLGGTLFDEKLYEESEHYLTAAVHHAQETGDEPSELNARSKLKELYFNTKQFEKLRMLS